MSNPDDLTETELRLQWTPVFFRQRWVPTAAARWTVGKLRTSSLRALGSLQTIVRGQAFDGHITVGDQLHGVAERGISGRAGRIVAEEFAQHMRRLSLRNLFHVPSEHPLGYPDGEDYIPHLRWNGWIPRPALAIHRDIGGRLDPEAIDVWREVFGPLWGRMRVGKYTLAWMTADFTRWRDRPECQPGGRFYELRQRQIAFLEHLLWNAKTHEVILFTHRPMVVFEEPALANSHDRLRAVVFADFHDPGRAAKAIASFGAVPFDWFFVPALWGMQFGVGRPGYGELIISGSEVSYRQHRLTVSM